MIARLWKGRTAPANGDRYGAFLARTAVPDYGGAEGNRGWVLLRHDGQDAVEFTFVSFWDSMAAVHAYAGADAARPKYYPEDEACLLHPREPAVHFEVVASDLRLDGASVTA